MSKITLSATVEKLDLAAPFRISGFVFETAEVVVVTLEQDGHSGRGEASGAYYLNDDAANMMEMIERVRPAIEAGADRHDLQALLPPSGARNAIDAAYWELEAKKAGRPVWQLASSPEPKPLITTFTLGAESPETMAKGALAFDHARSLKLKLTGEADVDAERVAAVRAARPDAWIGVDANQGYDRSGLDALVQVLVDNKVDLLEQPLKRGREEDLKGFKSPIPLAADESVLSLADVAGMVGLFDVINIKLDKCGGLTEGLAMARAAERHGLGVMVGNMVGTSLAMAPAYILGQYCKIVDLDGPIFLKEDRKPGLVYSDGKVSCGLDVWGSGRNA
ncbi:dipeptide epimerase [Pacificimonas sp. ICDLI1SI03]